MPSTCLQGQYCTCILLDMIIDALLFAGMINIASSRGIAVPCLELQKIFCCCSYRQRWGPEPGRDLGEEHLGKAAPPGVQALVLLLQVPWFLPLVMVLGVGRW